MKTRRTFISLIVIAVVCAAFFWLAVSHGVEKEVEVQTYNLPEYRSDTARAIDAYQQMINRMLDDNDRNWEMVQEQLNSINSKLDTVLSELDGISQRIARIENKMGIEEPEEKEPKPGELQPEKSPQPGELN
jgi:predicted PurR-regulated permease PerM